MMDFDRGFDKLILDGEWHFNYSADELDFKSISDVTAYFKASYIASVPGNFELDLMANELLPDIYFGKNIKKTRELENNHIWYYRNFSLDKLNDNLNYVLVFEGLDCFADIYVNGKSIGKTANMMITHEFDISRILTSGENGILVHLRPQNHGSLPKEYPFLVSGFHANYESLYTRKPAHAFGWDILPRIVSAGIFRSVYIEKRETTAFDECYLQTSSIVGNTAEMVFFYKSSFNMNPGDKWSIQLEGKCGKSNFRENFNLAFQYGKHIFSIGNPLLWNPLGSGKQNIYEVKATLIKNENPVSYVKFRHGIRTIKLIRESVSSDNPKGTFHFVVNGKKVFIKGTNWVPADALHSRDKERIPRILKLASELNCNMVRCWGGNLYEDNLFFELCDKLGIMVWQDFAMACAIYPQDEDFQNIIHDEAVSTIKRLRQHPSLALWAGDNECDQAYSWFGFNQDPNTNVLTRKILPECVRNHDPFRSYLPSSPYIDNDAFNKGDEYLPENHLWGKRDYYKSEYYSGSTCRFASEMGYHGCPSPESISKFITKENMWPYDNEEWLLHSTSPMPEIDTRYNFRVKLMADQVETLFGTVPNNLLDFSFASQISQAEAKKFFIELFRGQKWERTGIIWWDLMDGWPQFSDAVVDYYFEKKLAFSFIKRCQQDVLLMFREPHAGSIELVACNDKEYDERIKYSVIDVDTNEILLQSNSVAKKDSVTHFSELSVNEKDRRFLLISWEISGLIQKNHYLLGKPPFDLSWYRKCLTESEGY